MESKPLSFARNLPPRYFHQQWLDVPRRNLPAGKSCGLYRNSLERVGAITPSGDSSSSTLTSNAINDARRPAHFSLRKTVPFNIESNAPLRRRSIPRLGVMQFAIIVPPWLHSYGEFAILDIRKARTFTEIYDYGIGVVDFLTSGIERKLMLL